MRDENCRGVRGSYFGTLSSFLSNLHSADKDRFGVAVEGKLCGSENDGTESRSRWSESAHQWVKSGAIPLLSLEVCIIVHEQQLTRPQCKRLDRGKSRFFSNSGAGRRVARYSTT
jgi:hypothetical protein